MDEASDHVVKLPMFRLKNPFIQNLLMSGCLFCNPGLYLAVTLLGAGGGRASSTFMGDVSNGVLYGVFVFSAAFGAGTLLNTVGPRTTVMIGVTGYPIYTGSLWYFDSTGNLWFPVLAGAYLGLTAGCLWTTAAYIGSAYPEEKDKGVWRAIQWTSNVCGAAVGASVALGINWNATSASVPHSVYIVFIVIQIASLGLAFCLESPEKLVRSDGTAIAKFPRMSAMDSLRGTMEQLSDWKILLLIPCMFAPEMFFPFQASMNAYVYNLRTRTLNSLLNNLIQIPVTVGMGYLLSSEKTGSRKRRAIIAITCNAVWITGTYIAQTIWLASWDFDRSIEGPMIDASDKSYAGACVIYMLYAAQYGTFQNVVLWILASLTNDPQKSAAMGGIFVGGKFPGLRFKKPRRLTYFAVLSAGTAVSFGVDATTPSYQVENAYLFALVTLCWPVLYWVAWKFTTNTNYFHEENVVVPTHVREKMQIDGVPEIVGIQGSGDSEQKTVRSSAEKV